MNYRINILAIIFFVFSIFNNYGENTLNDINNTLILRDFKVLESDYDEGAYIDFSEHEDLFSIYNDGKLSKLLEVERSMYTFYTEFYINGKLNIERLACYVDPIVYPYNIYINGILIFKKSRTRDNLATSRFSTSVIYLSNDVLNFGDNPNSFVLQIYPIYKTDPISNIKILDYDTAMEEVFWRNFFSIHLIQGAFILALVVAIYYLFLFIAYKYREKTHLYYALFCISFALSYLGMAFQYYSDSVVVIDKISRIGLPVCVVFFTIFLMEFINVLTKYKKIVKIITISMGCISSIFIFLQKHPEQIEYFFALSMNFIIIPILIFSFIILILAIIKYKNISSIVLFSSFLLMLILSIHDIYYMNIPSNPYIWLTPYGFIAIIFSTVFILALENSKVYFRSIAQANQIKKSYDALKKSEEKNIAILNTIPDSMFYLDKNGILIDYNASDSLSKFDINYSIINKNIRDVLPAPISNFFYLSLSKIIKDNETILIKDEIKNNNNFYEIRMVESGENNVLAIVRDITNEKEAQAKAEIQQEHLIRTDKLVALGTLVAGVAHEINNPNNSILLTTDILQDTWKGIVPILDEFLKEYGDFPIGGYSYSELKSEIPESFKRVINNSRRIKRIITDLKNFARKDIVTSKQEINVNEQIKSSVRLLKSTIKHTSNNFSVKYDKKLPLIQGQPQRLEQVIINLIQNACNSLPDINKPIRISTQFDKEKMDIIIKIEDEGSGMDKETLKRAFDPFFTTRRDRGGTGLGLSVSNEIIKEHNGEIFFESELGKGTTATIIIHTK